MSHVLLTLALLHALDTASAAPAAAAVATPAAATPAATPAAAAPQGALEEGSLEQSAAVSDAVEEVMAKGREAVRVALPPVIDADAERAGLLERALLRALIDRRREDVISPAYLRAKLRARATLASQESAAALEEMRPFAADHVLLSRVESGDGRTVLRLELLHSETGEVLATAAVPLAAGKAAKGARAEGSSARGVRAAVDELVEDIALAVESTGQELRLHRTAVAQFTADDAAREGRLDRYLESELVRALKRRGFLVVERAQLAAAVEQQTLGQMLDETTAPRVGQGLGAQSVVIGTITSAGSVFSVSARVISTESGTVLGAGNAELPREGVVDLTAVEMRTPLEAGVRSAVAPGWGQAYNQDGAKAIVFAVGGYGGLLTTIGLGVGGVLAHAHYNDVAFFAKLPEAERTSAVVEAKALGDGLYLSALLAGGFTAAVWSLGIVDAIVDSPP